MPKIVFCTTCKGRTPHLEITLPKNLEDNKNFEDCKFVILDYNSQDHLLTFLKEKHSKDIESGRVVVYSYKDSLTFKVAHAKSMSMRLGVLEGADIVVMLDADNFTGPDFAQFIVDKFREPGIFLQPDFALIKQMPWTEERPLRGFAGRLAIRAQDFIKMGGYDEQFSIWGSEDIDMLGRLNRLGYTPRYFDIRNLHVVPHGPDIRFREYPEAKQNESKGHSHWIDRRTETVVNYGKFGMGTVYRNFSSDPTILGSVPTRVFGIGMHKTATTSLHAAFKIIGYDSLHWGNGEAPLIWQEVSAAGRSNTLEKFYAACDLPIPILYQKLDKAYPGSKFILTIRNEDKWLKSVERLWDYEYNPTRWQWDVWPVSNRLHKALYGRTDFNKDTFLYRYRLHNSEVQTYFKDRPDSLLVMDMDKGAGWSELCSFLNVKVPSSVYPRLYETKKRIDEKCS